MAVVNPSTITPRKIEVLRAWLPSSSWFTSDPAGLESLGTYRFDDPDGEVGMESHLLRAADGRTYHVPLTYRGAPLAGADEWLAGTMTHSVLGPRWAYDATGDPVYAAALATTILTGGTQAPLERDEDGVRVPVEPSARVEGSGTESEVGGIGLVDVRDEGLTTVVVTSAAEIVVRRVVDDDLDVSGDHQLTGTWAGVIDPVVLAVARLP